MSREALLQLQSVSRRYAVGEQQIYALREINLEIRSGEMVALVGVSGSGKSTLMNILGCLDRPSHGVYRVAGRDAAKLGSDELASLRCAYFGFVFQRYHLLPQLTARENVEIPGIYAGAAGAERHARATELLARLGLRDRLHHLPNELSGGQQQRVSIARALMNGGMVILADEPTGALDSATGEEVMKILIELNMLGHTLVIATHDRQIAGRARRIIEISDGAVVRDHITFRAAHELPSPLSMSAVLPVPWLRFGEATRMAFLALRAHRLRTALTALGVVIGVFAVVMTVALGDSAERNLEKNLEGIRANMLEITPGKDMGDPRAGRLQTLKAADVDVLRRQHYIVSASPLISSLSLLRFHSMSSLVTVTGVSEGYFDATGLEIDMGVAFDHDEVMRQAQVVVIDENVRRQFFGSDNPLGKTIHVGSLPCIIIGITGRNRRLERKIENKLNVWIPYTVSSSRLIGRNYLDSIVLRLRADQSSAAGEREVTELLSKRHRAKDFTIFNSDADRRVGQNLINTIKFVFAAIGVISLVVGGVGVMNIMLVSASERAKEIGIRVAVGARRSDIRNQFLTESVVACLLGAAGGVGLSIVLGSVLAYFMPADVEFVLSGHAIAVAIICATLTGVIAGYAPARNAAKLDPVEALARD
jgi:macrolide transport system ATP-binding/permease protein